jgi:hypothetical protein
MRNRISYYFLYYNKIIILFSIFILIIITPFSYSSCESIYSYDEQSSNTSTKDDEEVDYRDWRFLFVGISLLILLYAYFFGGGPGDGGNGGNGGNGGHEPIPAPVAATPAVAPVTTIPAVLANPLAPAPIGPIVVAPAPYNPSYEAGLRIFEYLQTYDFRTDMIRDLAPLRQINQDLGFNLFNETQQTDIAYEFIQLMIRHGVPFTQAQFNGHLYLASCQLWEATEGTVNAPNLLRLTAYNSTNAVLGTNFPVVTPNAMIGIGPLGVLPVLVIGFLISIVYVS